VEVIWRLGKLTPDFKTIADWRPGWRSGDVRVKGRSSPR